MQKVDEILRQVLEKQGWAERLRQFQAVDLYNQILRTQNPMLLESEALAAENGILTVLAENSVLKSEIFLNKTQILQSLNQLLKEKIITEIVVKIGG